jgi:hypothetical protein
MKMTPDPADTQTKCAGELLRQSKEWLMSDGLADC